MIRVKNWKMYKFRAIVLVWALEGLEKEEGQISVFSRAIETRKLDEVYFHRIDNYCWKQFQC